VSTTSNIENWENLLLLFCMSHYCFTDAISTYMMIQVSEF
jgi:hypothetical protein